jgi:PAS domain S-box-containing protein
MQAAAPGQTPSTLIRTVQGHITFWSPEMEQRYGYPADEALGQVSHELLRPLHWQAHTEIEAILADRSEWHGGMILHRADGQPVMVGNYWLLHADPASTGSLVTEVHTDIAVTGSPASIELADVMTTIAHDLSQPVTAAASFIGGTDRSIQQAWPNRGIVAHGLAEAAAQLARTAEIIGRVRALGASLQNPRLQQLHQRLVSTMQLGQGLSREAGRIRQQAVFARQEATSGREKSQKNREQQQSGSPAQERAVHLQNIQVYRRRLDARGLNGQASRVIRQLLAEEEASLLALDRQDVANDDIAE